MGPSFAWISGSGHYLFGSVPSVAALLLAVALVLSAVGFIRLVYFISIGYGLAVAGIAVAALVAYRATVDLWSLVQGLLLVIYGARLAGYLAFRERQAAFKDERDATVGGVAGTPTVLKPVIWIGVALLYVAMCSPLLFHLSRLSAESAAGLASGISSGAGPLPTAAVGGSGLPSAAAAGGAASFSAAAAGGATSALVPIGLAICAVGIAIGAFADMEKSRFKKRDPSAFCSLGLYRVVRCPNYFGEILVWTGGWVAGIPFYSDWAAWILSLAGLSLIVLIMLGSAKRLEEKQIARYGTQEAYRDYASSVPVLFPLVPVYSLTGLKIYLG